MAVTWDLHYDRRVSDEFIAHFQRDGLAHSLVEYAKFAAYPLDVQMRRNPKTGAEHASFYVGLTTVLDVHNKKNGLRFTAHKSYSGGSFGFRPSWSSVMSVDEARRQWPFVEDYLEQVIPHAYRTHAGVEGPVQSAASVFTGLERTMVDREVALHFRDLATKQTIMSQVTKPFVTAVAAVAGIKGTPPSSFGGECDLVALDRQGRLLAVEIKPKDVPTIAWSCAQATVYARLLERWVQARPQGTDRPVTILRGMLDQRARLGLAPLERPALPETPKVVPVVGIGHGVSKSHLQQLQTVQKALLAAGCGDPDLEVHVVRLSGRLDRIADLDRIL